MIYVITHTDLDGIGCAILMEKTFPDIRTFSIDYKQIDSVLPKVLDMMSEDDKLYITDISLNESQAEMCNKHKNINHVDHHSSSKKLSDKYPWSFTDTSHCATYHLFHMLSQYITLDDYTEFVNLVDNYDTWGHGTEPSEEARDLNRLLGMIGAETFTERFKISSSIKMTKTEQAIVATDKFQEERYLRDAESKASIMKDKDGNVFIFIAAERYTSSLGNHLLKCCDEAEYVLILNMLGDTASLRSKGKIDVGELAKSCGGGGHKKAAGFQLNDQAVKSFWRCKDCEWNQQR